MGDMLSQAEIDALLSGTDIEDDIPAPSSSYSSAPFVSTLTADEIDALGEIGNICMGTSATTLFALLGQKVNITTPVVTETTWDDVKRLFGKPYVSVRVQYTEGLVGSNLLLMKEDDVKIITDLMMGGDGYGNESSELSDLHLSAISEAMNQMVGSSATSMSSMFDKRVDIAPPEARLVDPDKDFEKIRLDQNNNLVKISFNMTIGSLIDSQIMQLIPVPFAKELVANLLKPKSVPAEEPKQAAPPQQPYPQQQQQQQQQQPMYQEAQYGQQPFPMQQQPFPVQQPYPQSQQPYPPQQQPYPPQGYPQQPYQGQPYPDPNYGFGQATQMPNFQQQQAFAQPQQHSYAQQQQPQHPVNVQPAQFQSFDGGYEEFDKKNIALLMDVPLQIAVELGRTTKKIREILEFGQGSILELDKLAGEPVDILVNGKAVAKGEVVVIDESFGVRITDILHPSKRL